MIEYSSVVECSFSNVTIYNSVFIVFFFKWDKIGKYETIEGTKKLSKEPIRLFL